MATINYQQTTVPSKVKLLTKLMQDISKRNGGRQEISAADRQRLDRVANSAVVFRRSN